MAPDLGFIVHAAERDALELAAQRTRDRPPERRLADAGRPDETQNRPFQLRLELHHGEEIENAVLDLFEIVVVLIENLGRALHIDRFSRGHGPWQADQPFEIGARDRVLGRHGVDARKAAQLFERFLLYLVGHAGFFESFRAVPAFPARGRRLRPVLSEWLSAAPADRTRAGSAKAAPAPGIGSSGAVRAIPLRAPVAD